MTIATFGFAVDLGDGYFEVSKDVVTPHRKWNVSLEGGRLKALFVCPRAAAREVAEIAQRVDLDYETVLIGWSDVNQLGIPHDAGISVTGATNEETEERLVRKLKAKYDVLVVAAVPWALFSPVVKTQILENARQGSGLLLTYADAAARKEVTAQVGGREERLAFLHDPGGSRDAYHCLTPATESLDEYEKSMETVIRTMFQVSGRKAQSLQPGEMIVPRPLSSQAFKKRGRDREFVLLAWDPGLGRDILSRYMLEEEKKWGVNGYTNCGTEEITARFLNEHGLVGIPYTAYLHRIEAKKFFDEEFKAEVARRASDCARAFVKHGSAVAYSLGDENYVDVSPEGRIARTPAALKAFRRFLQDSYRDIGKLNAEWGVSYASWDEAQITDAMNEPGQNAASWFDYRLFMDDAFTQMHRFARDKIKEVDPDALVGPDGLEQFSSYCGANLWQLASSLDMLNVYPYWTYPAKAFNVHAVRSFAKPSAMLGIWVGGYPEQRSEAVARFMPWKALFWGIESVWWYTGRAKGDPFSALNPDLTPTASFAQACDEIRDIRGGIDRLVLNAIRVTDKIAIHYSQRSWHASTLDSGCGNHVNNLGLLSVKWDSPSLLGHSAVSMNGFITAVLDMGHQFNMVATEQIEKGGLDAYRVLILPFSESLTETETARIRQFVKDGGLLIADYRIGVRNEHGNLVKTGLLDDVFGIRQERYDVAKHKRGALSGEYENDWSNLSLNNMTIGSGVSVTTGVALGIAEGNVPLLIMNKYGKGRAVYLNFGLENYFQLRVQGEELELRETLHKLIDPPEAHIRVLRAGEQYLCARTLPTGIVEPATETTVFKDGDHEYLGFIKDYRIHDQEAHRVRVALPERRHVYDLRQKTYVGHVKEFETVLPVARAKLYALLPQKIDEAKDVISVLIERKSMKTTAQDGNPAPR
ncbi:MAG: beta-galactosidase trimerization domain-containing protein [Verrucomicrobia bacterium]|nr:beta-galactosidase trimerization domain-containing protein [Verrucomicrobiota bacterium]